MNLPWLKSYTQNLKKDNLHHSLIISGREGLGKNYLAEGLIQGILCTNSKDLEPCGKCQSCKLYESDNHPDFHKIDLEEGRKSISINQIRAFYLEMFESPFLGGNKIFFIPRSNLLSRESYDALLKTLEEPPKNTFIILINSDSQNLPATILSRCHEINIKKPQDEELKSWLEKQEVNIDSLDQLIDLSKGKPLRALELEQTKSIELRSEFIADISSLIKQGNNISEITDKWIKNEESLLLQIEWMSDLLMDILRMRFYVDEKSIFSDTANISTYMEDKIEPIEVFKLLDKTIILWNKFYKNNNLRQDYHLQSLLVDWNSAIGLRS